MLGTGWWNLHDKATGEVLIVGDQVRGADGLEGQIVATRPGPQGSVTIRYEDRRMIGVFASYIGGEFREVMK